MAKSVEKCEGGSSSAKRLSSTDTVSAHHCRFLLAANILMRFVTQPGCSFSLQQHYATTLLPANAVATTFIQQQPGKSCIKLYVLLVFSTSALPVIPFVTPLRHICWRQAKTFAPYRNYWGIVMLRRLRSIRTLSVSILRAHKARWMRSE